MKKLEIRARTVPVHLVLEQPDQKPNKKSFLDWLREWIGVIVTATGIFSTLFYLAGRSFASGYFSAMNIPSFQVSFSLWEYGEVGWIPMLLYPIGMFAIAGLFWGGFYSIRDLTTPLRNWLFNVFACLKQSILSFFSKYLKIKLPSIKLPVWSREALISFQLVKYSINILFVLLFVYMTLKFVSFWGESNGIIFVLNRSQQVEILSTNIIPLDNSGIIAPQKNSDGTYIYQGFHLLTYNDGKYYLFREIDRKTCKPIKVYIIDANPNIHVNLLSPVPLSGQCRKQ